MPEPLDLEALRPCVMEKWDITCGDELYRLSKAAQAMFAEIERLRLIAAPLERLEAWRLANLAAWAIGSDLCSLTGRTAVVTLQNSRGNVVVAGEKETLPAAIATALDAWDAKYGKDGP